MNIQNAVQSALKSGWSGIDNIPTSPPVASTNATQTASSVTGTEPHSASTAEPTPAQLQDAVDKINSSMKEINSNLQFSIDSDTQRVVVKVVESESGKVIKQFPSEEALSIAKAIERFQKGILVKQSA